MINAPESALNPPPAKQKRRGKFTLADVEAMTAGRFPANPGRNYPSVRRTLRPEFAWRHEATERNQGRVRRLVPPENPRVHLYAGATRRRSPAGNAWQTGVAIRKLIIVRADDDVARREFFAQGF